MYNQGNIRLHVDLFVKYVSIYNVYLTTTMASHSVWLLNIFLTLLSRTKYVRGILWFSRRYAAAAAPSAASAFHRLRDNLKNPYRIASIFYM